MAGYCLKMNKLSFYYKIIKIVLNRVLNRPPELYIGEIWYVKLPNSITLETIEILEITAKTVRVNDNEFLHGIYGRFKTSDIEFIEKAYIDK